MNEIKTFDERKKTLMKIGKEKGYITFEELADNLKGLEMDSDSLDELYNLFHDMGIEVVSDDVDDTSDESGSGVGLDDLSIPKMDYNLVEKSLKNGLNEDINWIDIKDDLSLDSYYKTDIHWKNEKLEKVVNKIGTKLNFNITFPNINNTYSPFYGSLYARISTNIKADTLNYLTSDIINNASVFNYEKKEIQSVYTQKNLTNVDSYDVFLSGATPLLIINNNMSNNNRELIIFRDSFGSSITPLLIEAYKKITVIDLRYIGSKNLKEIEEISFNSVNDIIFLYSIPVINNSFAIK